MFWWSFIVGVVVAYAFHAIRQALEHKREIRREAAAYHRDGEAYHLSNIVIYQRYVALSPIWPLALKIQEHIAKGGRVHG